MQRRSENTRARLLTSALNHFALHGYDATSVDDICNGANVSKGAFYHHFESKQALFLSLLNTWLSAIDEGFAALGKSSVPETLLAMTDMIPGVLDAASDQLPMFLEFWMQASRDEKVWRASIQPYQHFRAYFADMVAEGIAEGTLKNVDPQVAGRVILSMAIGLLLQAVLEPEEGNWARTAREGMQILMKGLAT